MKQRLRPGFTVFDLLVLLAVLGFLLALLLPLLARIRQAAARTQSQNNLKQLGLACHGYADTYKKFPPGNDKNNFSAAAHLLPFLEQNALWQQIDFKEAADAQANAAARRTRIELLLSPLDPLPPDGKFGPTNYLFNAGSKYALADNDGICYQDSGVQIRAITDGLSNTLLTGETLRGDGQKKAVDVHRQHVLLTKDDLEELKEKSGVQEWQDGTNIVGDRCGSWMDGRFLQGTFTGTRKFNDSRPDVSCGAAGGLSGLRSVSNQAIVGFCDGSVRTVRTDLSVDTWKLLTSRNDGMELPKID